jgi:prepilin-type N-terminal cleavage/methylation domain-containing protein
MKHRMGGFSLVELSVTLLVLGIAMVAGTAVLQQSASARIAAVQESSQAQVRQSIVGYLYANHRLPCPAQDANGAESCASGANLRKVGFVPWRTLGLPRPDAGRLRYGVYRDASTTGELDRDLAVAKDRMNPLRVTTPNPSPTNGNAPNAGAPPLPAPSAGLLGATQSGSLASPLNVACNASSSPPCSSGGTASVNQIDVCLALNTASGVVTPPTDQLAVLVGADRQPMAFVVAAPGLLDAQGNGQGFDGANAAATDSNPTFASSSLSTSNQYDDQVLAVSHAELFSELNCATGLAAASHAHFNAATGAFVLERALYDYRDQLYVKVKLAEAGVAGAAAGNASAIAAGIDAAQAVVSATGDTFASVGARSFQIVLGGVGVALAVLGAAASILGTVDAAASLVAANQVHADFAARTTAITTLSISINRNALVADAIGF